MKRKIKVKFRWLFKNQGEIKKFRIGLIITFALVISQITTLYWLGVGRIKLETYDKNYREKELVESKVIDKFATTKNGIELGYLKISCLDKTFCKQVPMIEYESTKVGSNKKILLTYSEYLGETKNFNYLYYLIIFSIILLIGSTFITYLVSTNSISTSRESYAIRRIAEENNIDEKEVMQSFITEIKYKVYNLLLKAPVILSIASTFIFFIGNFVYSMRILILI